MSLVRMHFCTLAARLYGASCEPRMYGMNGTMPAIVKRIEGSGDTRDTLGTSVCPFDSK